MTSFLESFASPQRWLGWCAILLDVALKGTLILAAAGCLSLALKRASASARHLVWFLALSSLLLLPALSAALPAWKIPVLPGMLPTGRGAQDSAPEPLPVVFAPPPARIFYEAPVPFEPVESAETPPSPSPVRRAGRTLHWSAWALVGWSTGAALVLAYFLLGTVCVWRIVRRAAPVREDSPWWDALCAISPSRPPARGARVLQSDRVSIPMTFGFLRPVIVLPARARWSGERRRVVMLHELAHLERRDCLTLMLAQIACALYWFNPLSWQA